MAVPTKAVGKLGGRIPAIGYGVGTAWFNTGKNGDQTAKAALVESVGAALTAGFTHVDEAEVYGNEVVTGEALRRWLPEKGMSRESLFITSKVSVNSVDNGIADSAKTTLSALGVTYLDLYLIHAPFKSDGTPFSTPLKECWRQMESLVDEGVVRNIGVSNWRVCDLEEIWEDARIKPCVNQIEFHPYLQQPALLRWCEERGILIEAYAPLAPLTKEALAGGPVDAAVDAAADALGKSKTQILLRWAFQKGVVVLTTSSKPARMRECLGIFDFELTKEQEDAITDTGMSSQKRCFWSKAWERNGEEPTKP